MYLQVQQDGTIVAVYPKISADDAAVRAALLADQNSTDQIVEYAGVLDTFVVPKWDFNSGTVVESAAAQTITDIAESKRLKLMQDVDEYAAQVFYSVLTTPLDSPELVIYKTIVHLLKAMEANEIINDRDNPTVRHWPSKVRGGTLKKFPMLENESTRRGVTREQLADLVKSLSDYQDDLLATIEEYRPVARDNIENYVLTGDYQADVAAMQAIYDQYVVDLNTALGI